ncbi:MAG: hypothetical protein BIFFINMI_02266 [Phycisphaerae bacterium]|nr:hypothetical protein [Phycisphaerae bacterium]
MTTLRWNILLGGLVAIGLTGAMLLTPGPGLAAEGLIAAAPPVGGAADEGALAAQVKGAGLVLIGKVTEAKAGIQTRTNPPRTQYSMTFDLESMQVLKGEKPAASARFIYWHSGDQASAPQADRKYVAVVTTSGRGLYVGRLLEATDANVADARKAVDQAAKEAPAADGGAASETIFAAVNQGQAVYVAKLTSAQAVAQTMSMPPTIMYVLSFEVTDVLRGPKVTKLSARFSQRQGAEPALNVGDKYIIVGNTPVPGAMPGGNFGPGRIRPMPQPIPPVQIVPDGGVQIQPGLRIERIDPQPAPAPELQSDVAVPLGGAIQGAQPALKPVIRPMPPQPVDDVADDVGADNGGDNGQQNNDQPMTMQITSLFTATDANLAMAKKAVGLPLAWTMDGKGEAISPFADLGDKAWPKAVDYKFQPAGGVKCSKTGRPALLAGADVSIRVEQVPAAKLEKFKNPYGDGKFTVVVTNNGKAAVEVPALLTDGKAILWADSLVIVERGKAHLLPGAGAAGKDVRPVKLEPGQGVAAEVNTLTLKGISWPRGGSRVNFQFCLGDLGADNFFYYYSDLHDKMREAAGADAAKTVPAPAVPQAGDWTDLSSGEGWYKNQAGKEQEFVGTLEAVPNADVPSTLQRTSYYHLGGRTIYTGAKKMAALDRLVGKKVVIRGKPYDINLEGQAVSEIWPGAIRPARADDADKIPAGQAEPLRPLIRPGRPIAPLPPGDQMHN